MGTLSIPNRKPYPLASGVKLRATSASKVFIPAGILNPPGTPISELVMLSNQSTEIGLKESPQNPGIVTAIVVMMNDGDEISLGRSSEIMIDGNPETQTTFVLAD